MVIPAAGFTIERVGSSTVWKRCHDDEIGPPHIRVGVVSSVIREAVCVLLLAFWLAQPAAAQRVPLTTDDDPAAAARFRFGVVALNPRVGISNAGVDTNVFNSNDNEQRDFTFTLTPGTQMWLRTGKGLLSVDGEAPLVYFKDFENERSVNSSATALYEVRFNRVRPYVSAATTNTRQRPGYEIDVRARHYETEFHAGTDLRTGSKGLLRVDLRRADVSFAGDAVFAGRPLNQELNRRLLSADLGWHQRLTALTTWVVRVSRDSERFDFDAARNSDSVRLTTGFELGRLALIRGAAFVGYRKLTPADGGQLPGFSGLTSDVDVSYTAPTQTRLSAIVKRDVEYSYDRTTPYYIQTGWTAILTPRWDVQLSGGRDRLSYHSLDPGLTRNDFISRAGGGVGYVVGERVRVGLEVQSFFRSSELPGREYGGLRAGLSVTYGN
jgi:hypothetical protein